MTKDEQACRNLLQSIVLQAVEDYKSSSRKIATSDKIKNRSMQKRAYCLRNQCKHFLLNEWFRYLCELTELNDQIILKKLGIKKN